jgi:hypothetical protein
MTQCYRKIERGSKILTSVTARTVYLRDVCGCGCCVFLVDRWQRCTKFLPPTKGERFQKLLEQHLQEKLIVAKTGDTENVAAKGRSAVTSANYVYHSATVSEIKRINKHRL